MSGSAPSHFARTTLILFPEPADQLVDLGGFAVVGHAVRDQAAVEGAISSRTSSPFSRSVRPVSTRSTIASARPEIGASSTEP